MQTLKFSEAAVVLSATLPPASSQHEDGDSEGTEVQKPRTPKGIIRYNHIWNKRKYKHELQRIRVGRSSAGKYNHALAVKHQFNTDGEKSSTDIEIRLPALAEIFQKIYGDFEGSRLREAPPVADSALFFHARTNLTLALDAENAKESGDEDLKASISTALQYIEDDQASDARTFKSQLAHNQVTWKLIWMLLRPGALLYHWHDLTEQHQAVKFVSLQERRSDEGQHWDVVCNIVCNDGRKFGTCKEPLNLHIPHYEGAKDITELSVFPFEMKEDHQAIREMLISRGMQYAAIQESTCLEVSGLAMRETDHAFDEEKPKHSGRHNEQDNDYRNLLRFTISGRAMADPTSFRSFKPNSVYLPSVRKTLDKKSLTDEQYMMCSPVMLGFSLSRKQWCGLPMANLQPVLWSDQAFNSLIIDQASKHLIHVLIKRHSTGQKAVADVISGKGGGVIGLLDGNPGCGKTLTAEAVAEVVHRPLYTVSAGELGVTPKDVDKRLSMIFEVAFRWDAVVLLDEADVFLRERDSTDVERNALVSIFLRQLDYFQGIMIMTTNRLADCDKAFESRFSFMLHLKDLDASSQKIIWRNCLDRANQLTGRAVEVSDEDLETLAKLSMNGREIRNAASNAGRLAVEEGAALSLTHINQVLQITNAYRTG